MANDPKVRLRGMYKIFGPRGKEVLHHVKDGMGKEDLLEQYNSTCWACKTSMLICKRVKLPL